MWGRQLRLIRTVLFKTLFYSLTALWAVFMCIFLFAPTYHPIYRGIEFWGRFVTWLIHWTAGIKVEVRGAENLPIGEPFILVGKHESTIDGFLMVQYVRELTALGKRELFQIPFLGWLLRKMKIIPVDRTSGTAHQELPDLQDLVVKARRPLLIYPEGTRTTPGSSMPLKTGVYHIHKSTGLPVYTSATNAGKFWPHHEFLMRTGTLVLEFHPAIEEGLDKDAFMARVKLQAIDRGQDL